MPVAGIGAGGHCRVLLSIIRMEKRYNPLCLLDSNKDLWGKSVDGVRVEGGDDLLPGLHERGGVSVFNGVGSSGNTAARRDIYERIAGIGLHCIGVLHRSASIAPGVALGNGVQLLTGCIVNCGCVIGDNVLVNSGAIIEHDCRLEAHAVVSPGAVVCGGVTVGAGSFIGAGAVIREGVRIGQGSVVGAGAVVLRDTGDGIRVAGVPARVIQ